MENIVFTKTQDKNSIRIYANFDETSLELVVLHGGKALKRNLLCEELQQLALQRDLTFENYTQKLRQYVKDPGADVLFGLNDNEFTINRIVDGDLKVKYFTCKLDNVNYVETVDQIMDVLYTQNHKTVHELNSLKREIQENEQNKNSCESKLKELVQQKKQDEDDLLGRFVLILNEKKRKIQHLTELLDAFKAGRPTQNPQVKTRKRKSKETVPVPAKKETIYESEAEEEVETDEEERYNPQQEEDEAQNYDFLNSPPREKDLSIPQRVKPQAWDRGVLIMPQTSKTVEEAAPQPPDEETASPNSFAVDFDTQELLDML